MKHGTRVAYAGCVRHRGATIHSYNCSHRCHPLTCLRHALYLLTTRILPRVCAEKCDVFASQKLSANLADMPQVAGATIDKLNAIGITSPAMLVGLYLYEAEGNRDRFVAWILKNAPGLSEGQRAEILADLVEAFCNNMVLK